MTTVYWVRQHVSDVPASDDWLSAFEQEILARLRAPKRRRDWRLGRWTTKRALVRAGVAGISHSEIGAWACISIHATEAGVPYVLVNDTQARWAVSLSHSAEYGLCAVAERPALVGCDIETIGRRGEEFVVDWFTDAERALVASVDTAEERSTIVTLIWSAKESALKALGVGLRHDTREVEVELVGDRRRTPDAGRLTPNDAEWVSLVVHAPERALHGWWRADGNCVMTIVADPAPGMPVPL